MKIKRSTGRTVASVLVLVTLVVGGLTWRASWIAHGLLRSWVTTTVNETSGGVYVVAVGRVRFNFALRRVSVDSIRVTTNGMANANRTRPLATLSLAFHECRIGGVHIVSLIRNRGLIADVFGCRAVNARFVVPPGAPDTSTAIGTPGAVLVLQQRIQLPSFAPRVRLARVDFPKVVLDFHVQHAKGSDSRVQLERFRWHMRDFAIDPTDAASASRPMFSGHLELAADSIVVHPDSNTVIRFSSLAASLTDSTLDVKGFTVRPVLGPDAFAQARPYRRKYNTLSVGSVAARGVNVGALLLGNGLRARSATIDSVRMDVVNDHHLPVKPGARVERRTPQQWIAKLDRPIHIDSVVLKRGNVVYRLRKSDRDDFGTISFARIHALALDMNTSVAGAATRTPMRLAVTSWFQDSALLSAYFVVPLRARRFDMTYRGSLGPMRLDHLNQFVEATTPIRVVRGDLLSVEFVGKVSDGLTLGTITPLYNNLTIAVNREGSKGLAGRGGFLGGAARTVASWAGNWQKIEGWNPGDPRNNPRVGKINHAHRTYEALPDFIWFGLRDALAMVISR
jgi:hypothetical protein